MAGRDTLSVGLCKWCERSLEASMLWMCLERARSPKGDSLSRRDCVKVPIKGLSSGQPKSGRKEKRGVTLDWALQVPQHW